MNNEELKEKINGWVSGVEFPENKQYLKLLFLLNHSIN